MILSIDNDIYDAFRSTGSVRETAKEIGCSWNKVVKSLASSGVVINDTHGMIFDMHDTGMSAQEIARQLSLNVKTVQAYLPRVRPVYGENLSDTAKRIRKCREKKEQNKRAE